MEKTKTRKELIFNNTKFGVLKVFVQYILQFLVKTVFIRTLGRQYLGLNGLFSNIIGCLSIAELGIGSAIVYSMYKPIAENNQEKIRSLYDLYKKIYLVIAAIITVVGLAIIPFLKLIIKEGIPADINLYAIYVITLSSTVVGYIGAHNRSLIIANQRNDIESKVAIVNLLFLNVCQVMLLFFTKNYYYYIIASLVFTIIENIFMFFIVKKIFPWIKGKAEKVDKQTQKEISKNVFSLGMQQVGSALVSSTDNILISSMIGLSILGSYSNYNTIILAITAIITILTTVTRSSAGNLIATSDREYVYQRYKTLNFMVMWIAGFCSVALLCLLDPFILIWTGSAEYLISMSVVLVLVINFYISNTVTLTATFKISAGLMWFDRWKTIIQGVINLIFSIVLTHFFGLIGIFLGTLICYIVPFIMEPYILYKHYFKQKQKSYWINYFIFTLVTVIAGGLSYLVCMLIPASGIVELILRAFVCLCIPNVIYFVCYHRTSEFKELVGIAKGFLHKKKTSNTPISEVANENVEVLKTEDTSKLEDEIVEDNQLEDAQTDDTPTEGRLTDEAQTEVLVADEEHQTNLKETTNESK